MKIITGTPLSLYETGKRTRQEDFIGSFMSVKSGEKKYTDEEFFILCDGMGGHPNGDFASKTVTASVISFIVKTPGRITVDKVESAISFTYDILDSIGSTDDFKEMGTTLASLFFTEEGYIAAHIGDSRIYHIRPHSFREGGGILYKSWDHSLINMMIKTGQISEEEAKESPQRNLLLKAMQPFLGEHRARPYIYCSDDVEAGDYFFLCSDGVCGYLEDEEILSVITDVSLSDDAKISRIRALCEEYSRDNFSCWLIPVIDVIGE